MSTESEVLVPQGSAVVTENVQEEVLSPAQQRAQHTALVKAHKERTKQMEQLVKDKELEVAYWRAESDLVRYRFEKMDYYLKNVEIEPKYLAMVEEMNLKAAQAQDAQTQEKTQG